MYSATCFGPNWAIIRPYICIGLLYYNTFWDAKLFYKIFWDSKMYCSIIDL